MAGIASKLVFKGMLGSAKKQLLGSEDEDEERPVENYEEPEPEPIKRKPIKHDKKTQAIIDKYKSQQDQRAQSNQKKRDKGGCCNIL
ncbi:MAG: hypothetical protein EZS28_024449 [Streblomastix strix]|uniref:Uncharacterized protein n=1 Tax=Streblomastix strix TaxID=222440 RepID=A0A5J4VBW5_9EUKA|nr:MAG: hypothetical protein EZS28_024449 [Streblomastix strix]